MTALLVVILIWLIPFYIGFDTWSSEKMNALSVFMDVWFICDVFLNFRTGFVDHGATVMDSNKIAKHYFKSWFIIDFIASVPWEIFVGEDQATGSKTANKVRPDVEQMPRSDVSKQYNTNTTTHPHRLLASR